MSWAIQNVATKIYNYIILGNYMLILIKRIICETSWAIKTVDIKIYKYIILGNNLLPPKAYWRA